MRSLYRLGNLVICTLATLAMPPVSAVAVNGSWASDTDGVWSDPAKWTGSTVANAVGGIASFSLDFTAPRVVNLDLSRTIGTIRYNDSGAAPDVANLTISNPTNVLTMATSTGTPDITAADTNILILDTVLAGTGGLTIGASTGTGIAAGNNARVYLNKPSTLTGTITVSRGLFYMGVANAINPNAVVSIGGANNAQWALNGFDQEIAGLTRAGSGTRRVINGSPTQAALTFNIPEGASYAYASQIGNSGGVSTDDNNNLRLIKKGKGTQVLSGSGPFAGTTIIQEGILEIGGVSSLGATASGTTVEPGATLQLNAAAVLTYDAEPLTLSGDGYTGVGALSAIGVAATWSGPITLATDVSIKASAPLTILAAIGESGGSRTLTKTGAGTMTLSTDPTFTGPILVNEGTLATAMPLAIPGGVTVRDGAGLTVSQNLRVPALALGSSGTVALGFDSLQSSPAIIALDNASGIPVSVNASAVNVKVTGALTVGLYPLLKYTTLGGNGFAAFNIHPQLPPGLVGVLSNDTANSQIVLNVTAIVNELTWFGGVSGDWDLSTKNWNGGATNYQETIGTGDMVTFDDTLDGTTMRTNVILTTSLKPARVTVASSLPYSFTGPGKLSGNTTLNVSDTASFTLGTSNDYTGGTTLTTGTLRLGHAAALGTGTIRMEPATVIASDGAAARLTTNTLILPAGLDGVQFGDDVASGSVGFGAVSIEALREATIRVDTTFSGPSGPFGITKRGPAALIFKGNLNWTAAADVNINEGSFIIDGAVFTSKNAIRAVSWAPQTVVRLVVTNGGSMTIQSANNNYQIGNDGSDPTSTNIWDISGTIFPTIPAPYLRLGAAGAHAEVNVFSGGLIQTHDIRSGGGPVYTVFNFRGGTLAATQPTTGFMQGLSNCFVFAAGATIDTGTNSITMAQGLEAPPSAPSGGLTKLGSATLYLSGTNTYTGPTAVQQGTLQISQAHAGTGAITVADGATLAVISTEAGASVKVPSSTIGTSAGARLAVSFSGITAPPTVPAAYITNLTLNGTTTVDILALPNAGGTIPLIKYETGGAGSVVTGTLPSGISGSIVNNTSTKTIELVSMPSTPTNILYSVTGGQLTLSWPESYRGWILQSQTNSLGVGLSTNWSDVAGSENEVSSSFTIDTNAGSLFFRLKSPF